MVLRNLNYTLRTGETRQGFQISNMIEFVLYEYYNA